MKFVYAGIILIMCGAVVAWAASTPNQPAGPSPVQVQRMNAVDPQFEPYSTMCFKGKKIVYVSRSAFYELDDNGHPIPCVK